MVVRDDESVVASMKRDNATTLEQRVIRAAEATLGERQFVTALDVLVGLGWLAGAAPSR